MIVKAYVLLCGFFNIFETCPMLFQLVRRKRQLFTLIFSYKIVTLFISVYIAGT